MKSAKRLMAIIVAVLIVLSCAACGSIGVTTQRMGGESPSKLSEAKPENISAQDDSTPRTDAYRKVVQQTVNKFGIFDDKKASESYNLDSTSTRGLIDATTCDITGDGKDELFMVYADRNIYMNIYEYANNSAKKAWSDVASWGGVFSFSLTKNDEITTWVTYEAVGTPKKMYTYKDGKYLVAHGDDIEGYYSIGPNPNPEGIMKEALARELNIEKEYNAGGAVELMSVGGSGTLIPANTDELVSYWNLKVSEPKLSAMDCLGQIKYYGDKSKCKMTKEMALAYAEAIETLIPITQGNSGEPIEVYSALMDLSDDGMPILVTTIASRNSKFIFPMSGYCIYIWTWDGEKAVKNDIYKDLNTDIVGGVSFAASPGNGGIYVYEGTYILTESTHGLLRYKVSNAQISPVYHDTVYAAVRDTEDPDYAFCEDFPGADSERYSDNRRVAKVADLLNAGWIMGESPQSGGQYFYIRKENGNIIKFKNIDEFNQWTSKLYHVDGNTINLFDNQAGELYLTENTMTDSSAVDTLKEYAKVAGKPWYSYDDVYSIIDDSAVEKITKKIAEKYNGEIGEIYKLSDDLYYVIIYVDNEVSGTAVIKNTDNGNSWKIIKSSDKPIGEEDLTKEVNKDNQKSNIKIDYDRINEGAGYISEVLKNIDGTCLNPAAKDELVKFINASVARCSAAVIKAKKNVISLSGKDVKLVSDNAIKFYNEYINILNKNDITLDKPVTIVIQFMVRNTDTKKPVQIKITKDILDAMGNSNEILLVLGDSSCSVKVTNENLKKIINTHGEITVIIKDNGNSAYAIQFVDANGNIIEKLCDHITFSLPAPNELCTIQAEYTGDTNNWGGQFDSVNGTLMFNAYYSGTYSVIDKKTDIKDIEGLSEEHIKAIEFMVSKGFFALDGNNFNPNGTLNRYDFARALVKMFFALDNDAETTLADMKKDDPYYVYVASGETKGIIEGYEEDHMFHGTKDALREEVIALCSRTLKERKGYSEPSVPDEFLHFTDKADILWGHSEIALAVKEALIDDGGMLNPQSATSRADAALILYRLFMLLYEVEPVVMDAGAKALAGGMLPWAIGGAAVGVAAVGGVATFVLLRRRKLAQAIIQNTAKTTGTQIPDAENTEPETTAKADALPKETTETDLTNNSTEE